MDKLIDTHPFARTLGPGPYQFIGVVSIVKDERHGTRVFGPADGVESGIGTCAHCGHAIMECFIVRTAENRKFGVGCDCINKVYDDYPKVDQFILAVKNAKAKAAKIKRQALTERKLAEIRAHLTKFKDQYSLSPHPYPTRYNIGQTLFDSYSRRLQMSGGAGIARLYKELIVKKGEV